MSVSNLIEPGHGQLELFEDEEEELEVLDHVVDEIQEKFGKKALRSGGVLEDTR